jgi:hypothetical protein
MSKRKRIPPPVDRRPAWPPRWRALVSVLLLLHVTAVFTAPFTFATSSGPGTASPFAVRAMNALRAYVDAAYLNHGYFFFAPNPGPSHLLRARLEYEDGRSADEVVFPDRRRQRPRLLYHRYLMLSESLNSRYAPPAPPPEIVGDPEQMAAWREARRQYESLRESYRRHLRTAHGAGRVDLVRVEHREPTPFEFQGRPAIGEPQPVF